MKLQATLAAISTATILMSSCASSGGAPAHKSECTNFDAKIFFTAGEEKLAASADASVQLIGTRIAACTGAGGALDVVAIEGFPDRGTKGDSAEAIANARANAVRDAIIAVGVPEDRVKVTEFHDGGDAIGRLMRRRTEIAVTFR